MEPLAEGVREMFSEICDEKQSADDVLETDGDCETAMHVACGQKKKEFGKYPAILTEHSWVIKELLYVLYLILGARVMGDPEGQFGSILTWTIVSQSA